MKKYNTLPEYVNSIVSSAKEEGLKANHIMSFSSLVFTSPKKFYHRRGQYTKGNIGLRSKNDSYNSELQIWKKDHVFPFFEEFGFNKSDISIAWKEFIKIVK